MEITTKLPAPSSSTPSIQIASFFILLLRLFLGITLLTLSIRTIRYNNNNNTNVIHNYETATFLEKLTANLLHTTQHSSLTMDIDGDITANTTANTSATAAAVRIVRAMMQIVTSWIPRFTAASLTFYLGLVYGYIGLCQIGIIRPDGSSRRERLTTKATSTSTSTSTSWDMIRTVWLAVSQNTGS